MEKELTYNQLYQKSLRLLAARDYCKSSLKQKLKQFYKTIDKDELIDEVIDELEKKNYLDEMRYAYSKIRHLGRKTTPFHIIKSHLEKEKIYLTNESIQEHLEEQNIGVDALLKESIEKKLSRINLNELDFKEKSKAVDKIILHHTRKGHGFNQVKTIVLSLLDSNVQ